MNFIKNMKDIRDEKIELVEFKVNVLLIDMFLKSIFRVNNCFIFIYQHKEIA